MWFFLCGLIRDVVSVSRQSRDLFFKGLGKSWWVSARLGLKTKRLGLVSVLKLKVSFTSESFLTVKLLIQNKLSSSVRVSHKHNSSAKKANVGYLFIPYDSSAYIECLTCSYKSCMTSQNSLFSVRTQN